tara:strand:+ start:552 stop:797 length:246 start_codon:yes stop_codon:yes gene_type:complete
MLCNSWYINKDYEELVNVICPAPSFKQQVCNAFIQLSSLCIIKYVLGFNNSLIHNQFIINYCTVFAVILAIRKLYYFLILK